MRFNLLFNRSSSAFTSCAHNLMPGYDLPSFLLVPMNTAMIQLMMGTSSPYCGLAIKYTHWPTLLVVNTFPIDLTQDASPIYPILTNTFLYFIPISSKASYTGTPTVITATNIYGSQASFIMTVIPLLMGPPLNLTGGIFTTGTVLSASVIF